jgi:acyl-CoA thioesterase-1
VDVARRWQAEAAARLPAVFPSGIVFQFGLNDCAVRTWADGRTERRVAIGRTLECSSEILRAASAAHRVLMIGPAPVDDDRSGPQLLAGVVQRVHNEDVAELDSRSRDVVDGLGLPYLSVFDALRSDERWSQALRLGDGVHPTGEGYEALAGLVAGWPAWRDLMSIAKGGQ